MKEKFDKKENELLKSREKGQKYEKKVELFKEEKYVWSALGLWYLFEIRDEVFARVSSVRFLIQKKKKQKKK